MLIVTDLWVCVKLLEVKNCMNWVHTSSFAWYWIDWTEWNQAVIAKCHQAFLKSNLSIELVSVTQCISLAVTSEKSSLLNPSEPNLLQINLIHATLYLITVTGFQTGVVGNWVLFMFFVFFSLSLITSNTGTSQSKLSGSLKNTFTLW